MQELSVKRGGMKTLVTGATGFLGQELCRKLELLGHEVVRVHSRNADLRQAGALDKFNDLVLDRVYHLAAWTQAGDFCLYHPGEQWIINQQINTQVLDWWQRRQPQAMLIAIGSSCVYDPLMELREENYLLGSPTESLYTYAMTKRMLYIGMRALQRQYGHRFLCLVPSTLYGPDYHLDGRQMHFIFDVIRKIVRAKHLGETVRLWGDGHQRREVILRSDFVEAAIRLSDGCSFDLVNIGSGEEFTIRQFAELVCDMLDYDPELIEYDTSKYVGARSKCLRIDRLRELLPDWKLTPLSFGLKSTIEWVESNRSRFLS